MLKFFVLNMCTHSPLLPVMLRLFITPCTMTFEVNSWDSIYKEWQQNILCGANIFIFVCLFILIWNRTHPSINSPTCLQGTSIRAISGGGKSLQFYNMGGRSPIILVIMAASWYISRKLELEQSHMWNPALCILQGHPNW